MRYYLAPMEGITTYIYRNAYEHWFGGIDKYFTPFISDKNFVSDKELSAGTLHGGQKTKNPKEIQDILPENNAGIPLVPQIMSNNASRFLAAADKIASYGYDTVNLNLGCPSGTVTAKKRGSGFLGDPDELDAFLYEIYGKCTLKISIKTRLGVSDLAEWDRLLNIYAKYPIDELIIHTRLQQEFYTGKTHPECYMAAASRLQEAVPAAIPLCYNGDIVSEGNLMTLLSEMESMNLEAAGHTHCNARLIDCVMIGRGIIQNPGLTAHLRAKRTCDSGTYKKTLRAFHDEILDGYIRIMSGDSPTLFKMKDLWTYMSRSIPDSGKQLKKIRKANRISEYVSAVDGIFRAWE